MTLTTRSIVSAAFLVALAAKNTQGASMDLTDATLEDQLTDNKASFLLFYDSQCMECEDLSAVWTKLAGEWEGHRHGQILQADCGSEAAAALCGYFQIQATPTLVFGGALEWDFYMGPHDYKSLAKFAKDNISKPICTASVKGNCDKKELAEINKLEALSDEELSKILDQAHDKMEELHHIFDVQEAELRAKQKALNADFDAVVEKAAGEYDFKILMQLTRKRQFEKDLEDELGGF